MEQHGAGFLDHVTVLIGVAVGGKATAGIIHHPYYNSPGLVQCGCHDDSTSRGQAAKGAVVGRTMWGVVGLGECGDGDGVTVWYGVAWCLWWCHDVYGDNCWMIEGFSV